MRFCSTFYTHLTRSSRVRTRMARPWHVARSTHVQHICWFFHRLFLTLSHLSLDFLKFFSNFSTVVWFCCTSFTPCSTYDTLKTHWCTLWTTLLHALDNVVACPTHVRHVYKTTFADSFLVSSWLCLGFFLSPDFLKFFSYFSLLSYSVTLPSHLVPRTPRCYTSYTHARHVYNHICGFFPRLFLTLSYFLPLTWFLEILF